MKRSLTVKPAVVQGSVSSSNKTFDTDSSCLQAEVSQSGERALKSARNEFANNPSPSSMNPSQRRRTLHALAELVSSRERTALKDQGSTSCSFKGLNP